jgi:hypothetical protein
MIAFVEPSRMTIVSHIIGAAAELPTMIGA